MTSSSSSSSSAAATKLPSAPGGLVVGCVGGGKLGCMMAAVSIWACGSWTPAVGPAPPPSPPLRITETILTTTVIEGKLDNKVRLIKLAAGCNLVTMEIKHVGVAGLQTLEKKGVAVGPSSEVCPGQVSPYGPTLTASNERNF